ALEALWADLAGDDAGKAHRALWALAVSPRQSVPFLRKHLPRTPAPTAETRDQFTRVLAELDSDNFAARQKAESKLEKLGPAAEPLARAALKRGPSLEVRRRLERFIRALEGAGSTSWTRTLRALEALEHAAGPEARQLLTDLAAGDPEARLTREAKAA